MALEDLVPPLCPIPSAQAPLLCPEDTIRSSCQSPAKLTGAAGPFCLASNILTKLSSQAPGWVCHGT